MDTNSVRMERRYEGYREFAEFVGCRPVDDMFIPVEDIAVADAVPVTETGKQNVPPVPGGHTQ